MTAALHRRGNLVPFADRLLYLRVLRAILAGVVVADASLLPNQLQRSFVAVASAALAYVLACCIIEGLWRLQRSRGPLFFVALLIIDGVFLGYTYLALSGPVGPVRYLVLVYLAAVTLLTSSRTGVAVAVWQSVVQLAVIGAEQAGITTIGGSAAMAWRPLAAFILAMWVLTVLTALLAAVTEAELRRGRFELEQLARMGRNLENAHDPAAVGGVLLATLADTFDFGRMALFAVRGGRIELLTVRGLRDAKIGDFAAADGSVLSTVAQRCRTVTVAGIDPVGDPWLAALMPASRNVAFLPLVADGVVGVLVVETGQKRITLAERRVLTTAERYVSHVALALRNANLHAQVQQMAITDGLTQLSNRREFDRTFDKELVRAGRTDGRLSVVLLDIDHFKLLNDTHGHVVGDEVLKQVALALRESAREYDTIARYGGEEFAAVLPGCSPGVAAQVAERLRAAVQAAATDVPVTVSAGVATYPYDGIEASALLGAADRALYASKRAGRNQVQAATSTSSV